MVTHIDDLVSRSLADVPSWQVHAPGRLATLDNNESPYPLDPDLAAELGAELAAACLQRYPDAEAAGLRDLIAGQLGVPAAQVAVMNGMNDALMTLVGVFTEPRPGAPGPARVLYCVPSYVVYGMLAARHRLEAVTVPLGEDFALDVEALERALATRRPNLVFLTRPNNPTGTLWPREVVLGLVTRHPDVVFVSDEAYVEFAGDGASLLDVLPSTPNLVIARTLSKAYGLAGLRIGYLVASPAIMAHLAKARLIYNVGALSQAAAAWLLGRHRDRLVARVDAVIAERERLARELRGLPDMWVFPSHGNFVLVRHGRPGDGRATALWDDLYRRGILIRSFDRPGPLSGCLRITVGTPDENTLLLDAVRALVTP